MPNETKYTSGPWKVAPSVEGDFLGVFPDTGRSEFPVAKMPDYIKVEINEANACLIAAAPDLLAALKAMMSARMNGPDSTDIWKQAETALTKAEPDHA